MRPEFPPSRLTSFREQVMEGRVPVGYAEMVEVPEPGVVRIRDGKEGYASHWDVTEERIAYLMRDPNG